MFISGFLLVISYNYTWRFLSPRPIYEKLCASQIENHPPTNFRGKKHIQNDFETTRLLWKFRGGFPFSIFSLPTS